MKKSLIAFLFFIVGSCSVVPDVQPLVDPAEIAKFAKTIEEADLVFVKDGVLAPFRISPNGTYIDSQGITYQISQIIDNSTITSVSVDFGEQTHELQGEVFGVTFQNIAFKKATPEEITNFNDNINSKGLISEQNGAWKRFSVSPEGFYTTDGVTYQIGQVIDNHTILVVKSTGGMETHKLVATDFGRISASGAVSEEIAFLQVTPEEIAILQKALTGFIYHDKGRWEPLIIDANNNYAINGVTYQIGKITGIDPANPKATPTALVAKSAGGVEKHSLVDGAKYGPAGLAELAFKGSDFTDINPFITKIGSFIFAKGNKWTTLPTKEATLTTSGTYQDASGKTYSIGQINTVLDTVSVANSDGIIETHGIRGSSLGKINSPDDTIVSTEIAFKRALETDITTLKDTTLKGFIFESAASDAWVPFNITTTPAPNVIATYTVKDITYEIGRVINGNTIEVVSDSGNFETHVINTTTFNKKNADNTFVELAFLRATTGDITALNDSLAGFIYFNSGDWKTLSATTADGKSSYIIKGSTYEIGRVINGNTAKVVSSADKGVQTHSFYGSGKQYGIEATSTELAFKKDAGEIEEFANFINSSGLKLSTGGDFNIASTTGFYNDKDGISYDIGRVINSTTVEVVKNFATLETNGLRSTEYGTIDPTTDTVNNVIATASALSIFSGRLAEYSYAKNGNWDPIIVTPGGGFEAQGKDTTHTTYVINTSSINLEANTVTVNGINIELKDTEIVDLSGASRVLAIKLSPTATIKKYSEDITKKNLLNSKDKTQFFTIADGTWKHDGTKDYKIGRIDIIDTTTTNVIVSAKWDGIVYPNSVQTQGYREISDGRFFGVIEAGTIDTTDKDNKVFGELITLDLDIVRLRDKLKDFVYEKDGDWKDFSTLLIKPSKLGVYSYTVGGATYKITSINSAINAVTVTKVVAGSGDITETHSILTSGQYGVASGSTITLGKEIALKKSTTSEISSFRTEANKLSYASGGNWVSINITTSGTYSDRHGDYKIGRVDGSKVLVAKSAGGTEIHELKSSSLVVYNIAGEFQRTTAYKKSDKTTLINPYIADINSKGLKIITGATFTINSDGAFSDETFTYKIGRVSIKTSDSTTNVLVSSTSSTTLYPQTFGFRETDKALNFGEMGSSGGSEIMSRVIATLPKTDVLKANLAGFVFASDDGKWLDFPIMITEAGTYTVGGKTYNIVRYIDDLTFEVTAGVGGTIIHRLMGDQYGPIDAIGDPSITLGAEIAVKKDISTLRAFMTKVNGLSLTASATTFTINESSFHWSYTHGGNTYYIGRRIDEDTALVAYVKDGEVITEVHGIRALKYGKILYSEATPSGTLDPSNIIAE